MVNIFHNLIFLFFQKFQIFILLIYCYLLTLTYCYLVSFFDWWDAYDEQVVNRNISSSRPQYILWVKF
jgi:hypothetical protein